jgi:nicotinate-nucleotide adenylyltransferase
MTRPSGRARRIAVFGGTFDPIHNGHLRAATLVARRFALDRVLFVPSYIPPHKRRPKIAPANARLAMVELAVRGRRRFAASPLEVAARATSYSVLTLEKIGRQWPGARLFFLLGVDAFLEIETWREWKRLLDQCRLIVATRPGTPLRKARAVLGEPLARTMVEVGRSVRIDESFLEGHRIFILPIAALPISATEIRRRVRSGLSIRGLVPRAVERYIRQERLYGRRPETERGDPTDG